jgi:ribonucleoside-diphosphate reductase alpha chain
MNERRKLPDERTSITHKFRVGKGTPEGVKGYITVGLYEEGQPGEIFISIAKEGSTLSGVMDAFATVVSYALQYGVPLEFLVRKLTHTAFEPSGFTDHPDIKVATSIIDYLFRWLEQKFIVKEEADG